MKIEISVTAIAIMWIVGMALGAGAVYRLMSAAGC